MYFRIEARRFGHIERGTVQFLTRVLAEDECRRLRMESEMGWTFEPVEVKADA